MDQSTMRGIFRVEYRGAHNLFTPYTPAFTQSVNDPQLISEISYGSGITGDHHLVGCTVLQIALLDGSLTRKHDLSMCFSGGDRQKLLDEAISYARNLEQEPA